MAFAIRLHSTKTSLIEQLACDCGGGDCSGLRLRLAARCDLPHAATVVTVIALGYGVDLLHVATVVVGCDPHAGTAISIALRNLRFMEDFDCLLAEGWC